MEKQDAQGLAIPARSPRKISGQAMTFPIDQVRAAFPALSKDPEGSRRIYLDNPAGTQVPACVIAAISQAMETAASNYGGFFPESQKAQEIWDGAHDAMARMLGAASRREIVVAQSMTSLTYHFSRCLGHRFEAGDEIIVTRMDHEGDVSPWLQLAEERDLVVKWLPFNRESWRIEAEDLESLLSPRTKLLALNYASNLTGSINDVAQLTALAKTVGALVYVDAVQFAPHGLIDVQALGCDFLVCSSYKFFGPHLGVLWGREEILGELYAYKCRCSSNELPERFELGTPQTELLAGLGACVGYLEWLGELAGGAAPASGRAAIEAAYAAVRDYEGALARDLIAGIADIGGFAVQGIANPNRIGERVPTVSVLHDRISPPDLARGLGQAGICVWSGHNYAYEVVRQLGIDEGSGVLRIGLAHYNRNEEVGRICEELRKLTA